MKIDFIFKIFGDIEEIIKLPHIHNVIGCNVVNIGCHKNLRLSQNVL